MHLAAGQQFCLDGLMHGWTRRKETVDPISSVLQIYSSDRMTMLVGRQVLLDSFHEFRQGGDNFDIPQPAQFPPDQKVNHVCAASERL